jgi:hypothetical protein
MQLSMIHLTPNEEDPLIKKYKKLVRDLEKQVAKNPKDLIAQHHLEMFKEEIINLENKKS